MTKPSFILFCLISSWPGWAVGSTEPPGPPASPAPFGGLAETGSLLMLTLKVIGGLALVIGLMLLVIVWLKKLGFSRQALKQGTLIQVLDTQAIGPKKYISVLQIGGQCIAVGVTDQQITTLANLNSSDLDGSGSIEDDPSPSFAGILFRATGNAKKDLRSNE